MYQGFTKIPVITGVQGVPVPCGPQGLGTEFIEVPVFFRDFWDLIKSDRHLELQGLLPRTQVVCGPMITDTLLHQGTQCLRDPSCTYESLEIDFGFAGVDFA